MQHLRAVCRQPTFHFCVISFVLWANTISENCSECRQFVLVFFCFFSKFDYSQVFQQSIKFMLP